MNPINDVMAQCPFPDIELFEFTESQLTPVAYCNPVELELDFTIHADETCDNVPTVSVTIHLYLDRYSGESRFEIIGSAPSLTFTLLPTPVVVGNSSYDHYTAVTTVPLITSQHFDIQLLTDASYVNRDHAYCQVEVSSNSEITDFDPAEVPILSYRAYTVGDPNLPLNTEVELDDIAIGVFNGGILTAAESETRQQTVVINNVLVINQDYWISHGSRFAIREGGAIVIKSPYTLTIEFGSNTFLNDGVPWVLGCDAMWDRIEVESGASLVLSGAAILDGTNAITVQGGASVHIEGSDLVNNKVGVYKPYGSPDATINISNTTIGVNSAGLLPPNTGTPSTQGIFINHQTTPVLLTDNTYLNLQLGVNAQNSNVISTGETFTDIPGAGIYMGSDGLNGLTQSGGTFDNVRVAIEGRNINIVSSDNQMDNVSHGYRLYNGRGSSYEIRQNNINASNFGVLMFNWNSLDAARIWDNEINIVNSISPDASGIRLAGMRDFIGLTILRNNIDIMDAERGIYLEDCSDMFPIDNEIRKLDAAEAWDGISIEGGSFIRPECNNIGGSGVAGTTRGIWVSQAFGVNPRCNTVDQTEVGIHFAGANLGARVQGNLFNAHNSGFVVGFNNGGGSTPNIGGILGQQPYHGNRWVGPFGPSGMVHWGNTFEVIQSQFIVNNSEDPTAGYFTTAYPSNFILNDDEQLNQKCPQIGASCPSPPNPDDLDDFTDDDCGIALGTYVPSAFPDAQLWTAQRQLYRGLMEVEDSLEYVPDCLETFFQTADTSTIGRFENIRKNMLQLFQNDAATTQSLLSYQGGWKDLGSQLVDVMAQLETANAQDSLILEVQKDSLLVEMDALTQLNVGLDQTFRNGWMTTAQSLLSVNTAITADSLWEQNQKDYNQVWLEMIVNDQELPDQTQVTTLLSIAYQCPYAGGEAVYQSRALLGEGHAFDDSTLCNSAALPLVKQPAETVLDFHVFPNPANAFFTVELAEEAATAGTAVLTDLLGRTVAAQDFRESTREFFLIVGQVPAGRYLLTVEVDGERTTKPISIIK